LSHAYFVSDVFISGCKLSHLYSFKLIVQSDVRCEW
jgi:hypothetical protein